ACVRPKHAANISGALPSQSGSSARSRHSPSRRISASVRSTPRSQARPVAGSSVRSSSGPAPHHHRACECFSRVSSTDPKMAEIETLQELLTAGQAALQMAQHGMQQDFGGSEREFATLLAAATPTPWLTAANVIENGKIVEKITVKDLEAGV